MNMRPGLFARKEVEPVPARPEDGWTHGPKDSGAEPGLSCARGGGVGTLGSATFSVVARILMYLSTCLALIALRRRDGPAPITIPLGPFGR